MSSTNTQFPHRVGAAVAAVAAIAAVAVSALTIGGRRPAGAAAVTQPRTHTARGVDLSQPMGAQLLYHRLQQAASITVACSIVLMSALTCAALLRRHIAARAMHQFNCSCGLKHIDVNAVSAG